MLERIMTQSGKVTMLSWRVHSLCVLVPLCLCTCLSFTTGAKADPVAFWHMDEASWNGTPDEVVDSSGNGNHGTAHGNATTTANGMVNRAGIFDGSGDYVDCGSDNSLDVDYITVESWVKFTSNSGNRVIASYDDGTNRRWALYLRNGNILRFFVFVNNAAKIIDYSWIPQLDTWYHIAGVKSATHVRLYINGEEVGIPQAHPGVIDKDPYKLRIGVGDYPGYFNGTIDEVKIYNRALSPDEIKASYENAGPAAVWHMSEDSWNGTANEVIDSSGNDNHGTAFGGADTTSSGHTTPGGYDCGNCGSFDGDNDYVSVNEDSSLDVGQGTWEAWIYPTSFTDHSYHTVVAKDYGTGWWFGLYQNTGRIQLWVAETAHYSVSAVNLNEWSHIAATWNGANVKYYINGDYCTGEDDAETGAPVTNNINVGIGQDVQSPNQYQFTGRIDEVVIYGRALVEDEIYTHYEEGPPEGPGATDIYLEQGVYVSSVKDAGDSVRWKKISWEEDAAYGEELEAELGMIGLWHMNDDCTDSSGNGNHGVGRHGVTFGAGKFDTNGGSFDGINDYVDLPDDLGYATQVSAFAWFKSEGIPKGNYHIIFGGQELEISIHSTGYLRTGVYTNSRYVSNHRSGLTDGNWHFVGFTFNGSVKISYIDGVSVGEQNVSGMLTSSFNRRRMGKWGASNSYYLNGKMDETVIYDRALSPDEILKHYQRGVCSLKFQVRSDGSIPLTTSFVGPDGTTATYFTDAGGENDGINVSDNQYFQYQAYFSTENRRYTPELNSVTITYSSSGGVSGAHIYQWEEIFE